MEINTYFSKNIIYLRNYYGFNQAGMVKMLTEKDSRLKIHPSTISAWERGVTRQPTAKTVAWIARAFNDYTPFPLTGQMLLFEDIEAKFKSIQNDKSLFDRVNHMEKQIQELDSLIKHCIYRIQSLEENRSSMEAQIAGFGKKMAVPLDQFLTILKALGIQYKNNRFFTADGIDVTADVEKLRPSS